MGIHDEPETVYNLDVGQVAVFDSCIEILPNHMDTTTLPDGSNISHIVGNFEHRLDGELREKIGGDMVKEDADGETVLTRNIQGVAYSIQCDAPDTDNLLKKRAVRALEQQDIPSWVWAAYYEPTRIYVGGTHRPDERIEEHLGLTCEYQGSVFTEIFEPLEIMSLYLSLGKSPYELEKQEAAWWEDDAATFVFQS